MQFDLYSQYYDLIYNSKDYIAEANDVYDRIGLTNPKLLELGCGSGGHASVLSKLGCTITGLDLSQSMVDLANKKEIPNFISIQANIEHFDLEEKFDAAISMFHVMSYLNGNDSIMNCLDCVHRHLKPGGIFIFDFWFAPAVYHQGFECRTKTFENAEIKVTRNSKTDLDINKNIGIVEFDILVESKINKSQTQRITEHHPMRFFSIPEIQFFAHESGFRVIDFFDLHSANKPSLETWAISVKLVKQ